MPASLVVAAVCKPRRILRNNRLLKSISKWQIDGGSHRSQWFAFPVAWTDRIRSQARSWVNICISVIVVSRASDTRCIVYQ
jgi:hypothetical protein